jgi:murein DD-endopeptidase MepM/ murein hydrolase activator NlpD
MDAHSIADMGKLAVATASVSKALSANGRTDGADALKREQAAQEFASLLFLEVLKAMRAALPQEGLLENESLSRDIYNSMMDAEIAKVMAKRDATSFVKTVEKSLTKGAPSSQQQSALTAPVEGVISSAFGARVDPLNGANKFHEGIDIAVPSGTTIRAAAAGKVIFSGRAAGYGNMVEVEHGGRVITRYAHNSGNLVAAGEQIQAGQPIALVGTTGRSTGSHLHFEVRRSGKAVNPETLFGAIPKGSKFSSMA